MQNHPWAKTIEVFILLHSCLVLGVWARAQVAFADDFRGGKLDTTKWKLATYKSPDSKPGINKGTYVASAVDFTQGMLRICVQQQRDTNGSVVSTGGAIISKERFGYGTYEFDMRMSSTSPTPNGNGGTLTGAVSSGFIYYNKSEAEIDLEFLGNQNALWVSSWRNPNPSADPTPSDKMSDKVSNSTLANGFHHYKLVWAAQYVDVYIDGSQVTHQVTHVPRSPAYIILQHRGTNSNSWGGVATISAPRYAFFRGVTFTP